MIERNNVNAKLALCEVLLYPNLAITRHLEEKNWTGLENLWKLFQMFLQIYKSHHQFGRKVLGEKTWLFCQFLFIIIIIIYYYYYYYCYYYYYFIIC